jgi:hypothetical protein
MEVLQIPDDMVMYDVFPSALTEVLKMGTLLCNEGRITNDPQTCPPHKLTQSNLQDLMPTDMASPMHLLSIPNLFE